MKIAVLRPAALALALAVAAPISAPAQGPELPRPRMTVTGEATVSVEPDMAQLRAGVTSDAKSAREAADANRKSMAAVLEAVRAAGIDDKDLQTARYAIQPVYDSSRQPPRDRITGFQATNSLLIKVRDLDRLGEIIDQLVAAGANTMSGVEFIVSDPQKALDQARGQAIADAKRRAELYANAAGVSLGRPLTIVEQSSSAPPPSLLMRSAVGAPETPILPGERMLRVSVTVTYDLMR